MSAAFSCSLDVADRGGMSLEQVREFFFRGQGHVNQLSRERVRQLEEIALRHVREARR
jgi:DNA-directed RNA polymerase sigma subunit (sigma70/sigma32)